MTAELIDKLVGGSVVVERVDGEVTTSRIFLKRSVNVISQQSTGLTSAGILLGALFVMTTAKGGDLDDFPPHSHMNDLKAASDDPGVAKALLDLLRGGIGGDVEVLGVLADQ